MIGLKAQIEPFGLLFPLLWDITMVGIGVSIILRAECSRKTGMAWCVFSLIASASVGVAAILIEMLLGIRHGPQPQPTQSTDAAAGNSADAGA